MLGLFRSGIKDKLSYMGLFFISKRPKACHYVKSLMQKNISSNSVSELPPVILNSWTAFDHTQIIS